MHQRHTEDALRPVHPDDHSHHIKAWNNNKKSRPRVKCAVVYEVHDWFPFVLTDCPRPIRNMSDKQLQRTLEHTKWRGWCKCVKSCILQSQAQGASPFFSIPQSLMLFAQLAKKPQRRADRCQQCRTAKTKSTDAHWRLMFMCEQGGAQRCEMLRKEKYAT